MGGKGSGGYRRNSGNGAEKVDPGDNSRVIAFTRALATMEPCDLTDPGAIERRFFEFLGLCDEHGMKPGVASYAMALGMARQRVWDLTRHDYAEATVRGLKLTRECIDEIKKGYNFLETIIENLMMIDKGNPVKYFFLAKNHFGYKDQSEQININVDEKPTLPAPEEVAARYAAQLGRPLDQEPVYELPEG